MTGAEQSSVHAVLANERAAHLETVIELVPQTIAYLQIPLTPARAARLADFIARTGIGAQALVLDLLDDAIFDVALSDGGKSCVQGTSSYPQSSGKSNERSCRAPHDCAVPPSDAPARASGLPAPPQNSRRASNVPSERQNTSSPATVSPPAGQSPPSLPKYPDGRSEARA